MTVVHHPANQSRQTNKSDRSPRSCNHEVEHKHDFTFWLSLLDSEIAQFVGVKLSAETKKRKITGATQKETW